MARRGADGTGVAVGSRLWRPALEVFSAGIYLLTGRRFVPGGVRRERVRAVRRWPRSRRPRKEERRRMPQALRPSLSPPRPVHDAEPVRVDPRALQRILRVPRPPP